MKKILKIVMSTFVLGILGFSMSMAAPDCREYFNIDANGELVPKDKTVKNLISTFCEGAKNYQCEYNDYYFDAGQSMFLTLLCNNVGKGDGYVPYFDGGNSWFKKRNFFDLGIYYFYYGDEENRLNSEIDNCDYKLSNMNSCDLSYFLPDLFDRLLNDFFNIKQASNFGFDKYDPDLDKAKNADNFVKTNFVGLELQKGLEDGICQSVYYEQTCKYLKNYMTQLNNILRNTKIIDVENFSNQEINCEDNFTGNIAYCGLMGDKNRPMISFINTLYNEYLWYKLFMMYYSYELNYDYRYADDVVNPNISAKVIANSKKIYSVQENVLRSRQAISVALRSLSEINYSFPLHVGFLMYQEDAELFKKNLPKIYAPIRTLYDKLRNVQDANS